MTVAGLAEEATSGTVRCTTASPRSLSSLSTTSCTAVSAVVLDRKGPAEVYDGIDEKPVVLCRRQWYHSCNHSQGHSKEGRYGKPHNRIDDLFGQHRTSRATNANLEWICVLTRVVVRYCDTAGRFFVLQRCTTASMRTSLWFS